MSKNMLIRLNKLFKAPVHPFNLRNDGEKSYAEWQYEQGERTIKFYLECRSKEDMFKDKLVLDMGCGAGGKSLYYTSLGATVIGVDIVKEYERESNELREKLGISKDSFQFILADAKDLPFDDECFDTIILNDAFEHVDDPERAVCECMRVLKKNGRAYINFPPYYHPFGAHLSDAIYIPWVHMLFRDKTLIEAYEELVLPLPDGKDRINFRISLDEKGKKYFSYINKMTIKRAKNIIKRSGITPVFYREIPLRKALAPLAKIPLIKEMFVKMVVMVLEKR